MNYSASQGTTTPIYDDTPNELSNLRARLNTRTEYKTPFFLMPLRMETRFMKVDTSLMPHVLTTSVRGTLVLIGRLTNLIVSAGNYIGYTASVLTSAMDAMLAGTEELQANISSLSKANLLAKSLLTAHVRKIESAVAATAVQMGVHAASLGNNLTDGFEEINGKLQSIKNYVSQELPSDNEWQSFVSTTATVNAPALGSAVSQNEDFVDQLVPGVPFELQDFDNFLQNTLQQALTLFRVYNNQSTEIADKSWDMLYFWNYFSEIDTQIAIVFAQINTLREVDSVDYNALEMKLSSFARKLRHAWMDFVAEGKSQKQWVEPPVENQMLREDEYQPSNGLEALGNDITDQLSLAEANLQAFVPGSWEEPKFNYFLENINSIGNILSAVPAEEHSYEFLWSKISPLNKQLAGMYDLLQIMLQSEELRATDYTIALDNAIYDLELMWNAGVGISYAARNWLLTTISDELWIRVYPDDILIYSHEKALTQAENAAGQIYWQQWWSANGDTDKQLAAWRALVALYGPQRAAWIVKVLTPTNISTTNTSTSIFSTISNVSLLSTYASQLVAVATMNVGVVEAAHLDTFTLQLNQLYADTAEIDTLPISVKTIAQGAVVKARDDFSDLSSTIQIAEDGTLLFGDQISSINSQFDAVLSNINAISEVASWTDVYDSDPSIPIADIKNAPWTTAPKSDVMPDRFLFAAVINNPSNNGAYIFRHIKIGEKIPQPLISGIHPQNSNFGNAAFNNLLIDPNIKWMFDFDEAVSKGMATRLTLHNAQSYDEISLGFNYVLALGLNLHESETSVPSGYSGFDDYIQAEGKRLLQELLDNHHYTSGLGLLRLGTPTNNTDESSSGHKQPDQYDQQSFQTEIQGATFTPNSDPLKKKDGQWLADALGINYSTLQHILNTNRTQISNAIAANRALWPATAENFMTSMMGAMFTRDNIKRTKEYFTDYVLGRGALPSIRVGNQPYGVLPVTAFGRWEWLHKYNLPPSQTSNLNPSLFVHDFVQLTPQQFAPRVDDYYKATSGNTPSWKNALGTNADAYFSERFGFRLGKVLEYLSKTWYQMASWHVKTVDKNSGGAQTQKDFLEILGTDALMAESYNRYMLNSLTFDHIPQVIDILDTLYSSSNPNFIDYANFSVASKWDLSGSGIHIPNEFMNLFTDLKFSMPSGLGNEFGVYDFNNFPVDLSGSNMTYPVGPGSSPPKTMHPTYYKEALAKALRIFQINELDDQFALRGPSVEEKIISETEPLIPITTGVGLYASTSNYIQWLQSAYPVNIWKDNHFQNMHSRSLLFLLLRQSMLLTYQNAAMNILEAKKLLSKEARQLIGTPEGLALQTTQSVPLTSQLILTKWQLLFNSIDSLRADPKYVGVLNFYNSYQNPSAPGTSIWEQVNLGQYLRNPGLVSSTNINLYNDLVGGTNALNTTDIFKNINEVKDALDQLKFLSTAELDRLLREHIDLCAYRLDAWNYGMVNKRLWEHRDVAGVRKTGIYLGAYGWLVDVKPKTPLSTFNSAHIPSNLTDNASKVFYDSTNLGFIHTPSIAHALTAAILRSGYVSERDSGDNRFAVNLSSERIRAAMALLEGIRQGQTLGALLGYQFEKGLHERYSSTLELDKYIYDFRRTFPLEGEITPPASTATAETVRPSNVTDGIELLNFVRGALKPIIDANPKRTLYEIFIGGYSAGSVTFSTIYTAAFTGILPPTTAPSELDAVMKEIDRIANNMDALSDLAVAEGVFQVASGNFARSAAVLEALTEGKNPPEPEIVNTPRSGYQLAHRTVTVINPGTATSPWTNVPMTPRAKAEPSLNHWIAQILTAPFDYSATTLNNFILTFPDQVGCLVTFKDSLNVATSITVTLKNLGIQPIDLLYLVQGTEYRQELVRRVAYFARKNTTAYYPSSTPAGMPQGVEMTVHLMDKGFGTLASYENLLTLLNSVSNLIRGSRWLKATDFQPIPTSVSATSITASNPISLTELVARTGTWSANHFTGVGSLLYEFGQLSIYFTNLTSIANDTALDTLRDNLLLAADFGVDAGIPVSGIERISSSGPGPQSTTIVDEMLALAKVVGAEMSKRYNQAKDLMNNIIGLRIEAQASRYLDAAAAVLGSGFTILPQFRFDLYGSLKTDIMDQLVTNVGTVNDILRYHSDPVAAMQDWAFSTARVQEKMDDLETVRMLSFDDNAHPLKTLRPVQFPFKPYAAATSTTPAVTADYWLGAEYSPSYTPSSDKLSVSVLNHDNINYSNTYYCGFVIDEWTEMLPLADEVSGITFNYDQPNAKPPQNVLLAVNPRASDPSQTGSWMLEDLLYTLMDTIDMAKVRMVEPDHFKALDTNNPNYNTANYNESKKFEIFKWLLPAVVGEVTPHIVQKDSSNIYSSVDYTGSSDSIQQVSFEYNPNNETIPNPGSSSSVIDIIDWSTVSAEEILANTNVQQFVRTNAALTQAAMTQNQLLQNLSNF